MAGEKARSWMSTKFWLGVVFVLWVATAGAGGFLFSHVSALNATVLRLTEETKEREAREQTFMDNLAPMMLKLTQLEDEKLAWERQQQEYEAVLTEQRARSQEIAPLLEKARKLESQQSLYVAMKVYCEAAQVGGNLPVIADGLQGITKAVSEKQEKEEYMTKIRLYDFTARIYKRTFDEDVPGIEFKLQNTGTRVLSRVVVTVYFQDSDGSTIYEEKWQPVNGSSWMEPTVLRPGYIWQLERNKFYPVEKLPSEWKPGPSAAYAKVTDIEFAAE